MLTRTERPSLQPTLSLYLGGSGISVGESLLDLTESLPAEERHLIEPFFIDSQEPALTDHARARHYCYQDLSVFSQPIYREFTEQRFPENLGVSPVMNSCEGCGVTRIFGAASIVACRDDFMNLVEQAVSRLRKRRRESTQPLQVFITASACGGTGAGMIIDAAALVRHYFREHGENPRIFLFLVGPTVYVNDPTLPLRDDQRDRMRASTYALIKELNHFAEGNPFRSAYRLRDKVIEISNARDDDRLFDWVYFIDGKPEQSGATRSLAEVTWTIAEAQVHLCVTEVGRKVAESLPNQREERMRDFALHFVHADNKDRLPDPTRRRLDLSSRKTFMASFAVRNVRFPAEEIKTWFRWSWVRDGLLQTLDGKQEPTGKAPIDEFDDALGWDGHTIRTEGLLAALGLRREQLLERASADADPASGVPQGRNQSSSPEQIADAAEEAAAFAESLIAEIRSTSSVLQSTDNPLLARALSGWTRTWTDELRETGRITERLWALACDPATGRGLRFLDALLVRAAELLTQLTAETIPQPQLNALEDRAGDIRQAANLLRRRAGRETGIRFRFRQLLAMASNASPYSTDIQNRSRNIALQIRQFRQEIVELRSEQLANSLAPRAWLDAARELKRWRESMLAPAITSAMNALTLAENESKLSRNALKRHSGRNARGQWQAHTTVQIADDELLQTFSERLANVLPEDLVLAPLQEQGISREHRRLSIRTLRDFDRETTVDILFRHVEQETVRVLTFLDNGWMLREVGARLETTAGAALDNGSEPLVGFSRPALGQQLQGYLLTPAGLILPEPFGRRLERMNRLGSRDPLQLGVVTFVFGIPPNALDTIADLFEQYTIHLGDQTRNKANDRYPLHVFHDAPEKYNEPYSPLLFHMADGMPKEVLEAARVLWPKQGAIRLDIRVFNEKTFLTDNNQFIELAEKVLRRLINHPGDARRLFVKGRFPNVERLYNGRRYRAADTWLHATPGNGNGNGHGDDVLDVQLPIIDPAAAGDSEPSTE